jgi:phosphocarrier protein HPr
MTESRATILNQEGLHARLAARLVSLASKFRSRVVLEKDSQTADAKSIMSVLILAAGPGTELRILAEGDDEKQAAEAIAQLIRSRFGDED